MRRTWWDRSVVVLLLVGALVSNAAEPSTLAAQEGDGPVRPFPYALNPVSEVSSTLVAAGLWTLRGDPRAFGFEPEIASLGPEDVNPFDRLTVHLFSRGARDYSDRSRDLLVMGAAAVLFSEIGWNRDFPVLALMAAEAGLLTATLTTMSKSRTRRPRPYVFNDDLSVAERAAFAREGGDALESFFSGHTTAAFGAAMFAATVWNDLHGWDGAKAHRLRTAALGLAGTTAIARVVGGMHHPTDVVAGAVVGSLVGWGVPWLHRRERREGWRILASGDAVGLQVPVP